MTSLTREATALIGKDPMDLGVLGDERELNAMDGHMESKEELYD